MCLETLCFEKKLPMFFRKHKQFFLECSHVFYKLFRLLKTHGVIGYIKIIVNIYLVRFLAREYMRKGKSVFYLIID